MSETLTKAPYVRMRAQEFREKVKEFLDQVQRHWNAGDLGRFCNDSFDKDAVFINPEGMYKGLDAIRDFYKRSFPDSAVMGPMKLTMIECRFPPAEEERDFVGTGLVLLRFENPEDEEGTPNHAMLELAVRNGNMVIVREAAC